MDYFNYLYYIKRGSEEWLTFPDLWSGQKPWWNWYLIPVVNFGEVRRAQLAKFTLLTSTLVLLGSFQTFLVCSNAKERVGCGKQLEATVPIKSLVKLQPWFLSLRWNTCLRQNCSVGSCPSSEEPALGQNALMMILGLYLKSMQVCQNIYSQGYCAIRCKASFKRPVW